ncbi:MAG: heme exporter protein CcmD [Gallionella sp.]
MTSLDIWMREYPIAYVVLGSYMVAFVIFAVEVAMVRHKRKITLEQIRMMREAEEDE